MFIVIRAHIAIKPRLRIHKYQYLIKLIVLKSNRIICFTYRTREQEGSYPGAKNSPTLICMLILLNCMTFEAVA